MANVREDIIGTVSYPYECEHSAPPCGRCPESWSQFDPVRGSMGKNPFQLPGVSESGCRRHAWNYHPVYHTGRPGPCDACTLEAQMVSSPKPRGLYDKFAVTRRDGSSEPGRKHDGCDYFVLDLTHDPHAAPALLAYARSCAKEYPELSKDLFEKLKTAGFGS